MLPEFIPFNDDYAKEQIEKKPLPPPQNRQEPRSPKHSDRDSERSSGSRFSERRMSHENGSNVTSPKNAYRSPQKADVRRPSPPRRASPNRVFINRHNSPQRPRRISPPRGRDTRQNSSSRMRSRSRSRENENHFERGDNRSRNRDRLSNEPPHGSVFDRMSSPPMHPVRRRFRDTRSREDSRGPPHFYRTIEGNKSSNSRYEDQLDSEEVRLNNPPNFARFHRDSPFDYSKRYASGPQEIRGIQAFGMSRFREDNLEIRDLRDRLIAAEAHCHGLETTVLSYHREIVKLRSIVNELISDFERL